MCILALLTDVFDAVDDVVRLVGDLEMGAATNVVGVDKGDFFPVLAETEEDVDDVLDVGNGVN